MKRRFIIVLPIATLVIAILIPAYVFAKPASQPPIPADHVGRTQCLVCHATGVGGAPIPPPAIHANLQDNVNVCTGCHQFAAAAATPTATVAAATPTATVAAGTPTATAAAATPTVTVAPTQVPRTGDSLPLGWIIAGAVVVIGAGITLRRLVKAG